MRAWNYQEAETVKRKDGFMKTAFKAFMLAVSLSLAPIAASADDGPVVVELYTSQGCSSCPPADRLLRELKKRNDIIAIALHVDYWDYIGWKDQFADPDFTVRQRAYAREGGRRMIYTPQMIIGGDTNIEGAQPMKVLAAVADAKTQGVGPNLKLTRQGQQVRVRARQMDLSEPVDVILVRYEPEQEVRISRGENRGRTLTYSNIVTSWESLGTWDGEKGLNFVTDARGDDAVVVFLQYPGPGKIIGAAELK